MLTLFLVPYALIEDDMELDKLSSDLSDTMKLEQEVIQEEYELKPWPPHPDLRQFKDPNQFIKRRLVTIFEMHSIMQFRDLINITEEETPTQWKYASSYHNKSYHFPS